MNTFTDGHPWTGARPSPISPASSVWAYGQAVAGREPSGIWMVAKNLGSWFLLCFALFCFLWRHWACRHVGFDQREQTNWGQETSSVSIRGQDITGVKREKTSKGTAVKSHAAWKALHKGPASPGSCLSDPTHEMLCTANTVTGIATVRRN